MGIRELKDNFSSCVRRIEAGERIAVTVHGRVVAELVPPAKASGAGRTSRYEELVRVGVIRPALEAGDRSPPRAAYRRENQCRSYPDSSISRVKRRARCSSRKRLVCDSGAGCAAPRDCGVARRTAPARHNCDPRRSRSEQRTSAWLPSRVELRSGRALGPELGQFCSLRVGEQIPDSDQHPKVGSLHIAFHRHQPICLR